MNEIIEEVIKAYGDVKAVQQRFSYSEPMGVYNWRKRGIPRSLVAEIYVDTGIAIDRLMKATDLRRHSKSSTQKKLKPKAA